MKWIIAAFAFGFLAGQFSQDFSLKIAGYRLGIGSEGYALQSTSNWHVVSQGWFPWHKSPSWVAIPSGDIGQVLVFKDGVGTWQKYEPQDEVSHGESE